MAIAKLVGGQFDGETIEVAATARSIDVHRDDGALASYAPTRAGTWNYVGTSRATSATDALASCGDDASIAARSPR